MKVGRQLFLDKYGGIERSYDVLKVIKSDNGIYIIKNYFKYFEVWKVVTSSKNHYSSKFICKKYNPRDCMRTIELIMSLKEYYYEKVKFKKWNDS